MRHDGFAPRLPRILYCTDTFPPQVNGVSVVTAVTIAGMQERGWVCGVVSPRYPKPYGKAFRSDAPDLKALEVHEKLPSVPFPPYPDIRLAAPMYRRVADVVRDFRPDLIHCQTEFVVGRLGQRAAEEFGIPLVSSYHTDFSRYTESYGMPFARPSVTRYIARFHGRSRRVYTPSEPAKNDLAGMGVHNVEVWGRGVDVHQFRPDKWSSELRLKFGLAASFVFLHVGRIAAEKNVHVVLEAFDLVRRQRPDLNATLVIAGAGPELTRLRNRAPAGVKFLGNLDRHGVLPTLYASADAFVYASETETLGLVVLEAMASGLPVIATPAGGVADNLRDEHNGLAFPPRDAEAMTRCMARVATDETLRKRLSSNARTWAEERSWSAELDRLSWSYHEVLDGRSEQHRSASGVGRDASGVLSR
jgi:phosphatidylinositol alpha 1,6-mannosyltransferase